MSTDLIKCSCITEGVTVDVEGYDEIYLSFWEQGYGPCGNRPLKDRLKHMWRIFRKGSCHSDQLILTIDEAEKLIDLLEKACIDSDVLYKKEEPNFELLRKDPTLDEIYEELEGK